MRLNIVCVLTLFVGTFLSCQQKETDVFSVEQAQETLNLAAQQYKGMISTIPEDRMPRTFEADTLITSDIWWWTSGFFPGTLWYLYEHTSDETLKAEAHKRTLMLDPIKHRIDDHDVGFQLFCSYGNALRLTGDSTAYLEPIITGAASLSTRYNDTVGLIKSWDWGKDRHGWLFPVIIDNMMNLELLMWVAQHEEDEFLEHVSIQHANTSMKNLYREDMSCYHVVDFDPETGELRRQFTHQGYSDESAWSRGQAWGVYGFTLMYRKTSKEDYLEHAINTANFMLDHPNMPEDLIPYWDYDAPEIPDALRDASAAAILASALLELSQYVSGDLQDKYFNAAEKVLSVLSSDAYFADYGTNGFFLLRHSVGHKMNNSEVDVPLTYADYYFVEALLRYIELKK